MTQTPPSARRGVLAIICACGIWGLSGIFYHALAPVPPLEVLAHRTLWSLVFFLVVLGLQRRLGLLGAVLGRPRGLWPIALAATMISVNWFGFILSVQTGHALEASLGYYIFPLIATAIGVLAFRDRLQPLQCMAVALATIAVAVLTLGLGVTPWIALLLAATFALYGALKKLTPLGPMVSTAAEVALLAPLALVWLWGVHRAGWTGPTGQPGGWFGHDGWRTAGLMLSGPLTGLPLLLFSYASRQVRMTTLGLAQYLNPTLQFLVAVLVFGEPFTLWHRIAFALIWTALAIYSADSLWQSRRARMH